MSSKINLKDQFLWVSNKRLSSLITFAVQVGAELARSDVERSWVEKLRQFEAQVWPGIDFDLDERFPCIEEKKFWTRVFDDVARRIFLRQLGNHEITFWQSSAIGDAYIIARMLTGAVQEVEMGWHPTTENDAEAETFNSGPINLQM